VVSLPDTGLDYQQTLATIERSILEQALETTGGNKKAAAEMLGLKRTTLLRCATWARPLPVAVQVSPQQSAISTGKPSAVSDQLLALQYRAPMEQRRATSNP
jgi:hypothetical protein